MTLRLLLAAGLVAGLITTARAEERILWVSIGDGITQTSNLQNAINFAVTNNFNAICLLTRYRANAYYIPNRDNSTFPNSEPNSSGAAGDSLQYVIDRGHEAGLRVYASYVAFMVTDGTAARPAHISSDWLQWIYRDTSAGGSNTVYNPDAGYPRPMVVADVGNEGLWVDPGRADVRAYTINVLKDLVTNYDLDGVIFDRVRYPGEDFPQRNGSYGYNPTALSQMSLTNPAPTNSTFTTRRRESVSTFLTTAYSEVAAIKPWMIMGAAPIIYGSNLTETYSYVFQHFPTWNSAANSNHSSGFGNLDLLLPQYYRSTASTNASLMDLVNADIDETNRIFHGSVFPAYDANYLASTMAQNICDTRSKNMVGHSWFAYAGSSKAGYMAGVNAATPSCGTGVMAAASPKTQFTLKAGWDSLAPNGVTGFTGTPSAGNVNLSWTAPVVATDGDSASRYLVYRGTAPGVKEYYANLVTKTTVSGTSLTDSSPGSTNYYKIVSVDDYNNHGPAVEIGPIDPTAVAPTWKISPISGGTHLTYTWFAADANTNGMAYNPTTGNLIVVNRTPSLNIVKVNSANGTANGTLNVTGITGGTTVAVRVDVTNAGVIYVSNLAAVGSTFKIYRYANEAAAPTVAYEEAGVSMRMGDDMDVTGTGNSTKILVTNATAGGSVPFFTTTDGGLTFVKQVRTGSPAIVTGTSPVCSWHSNGTDYYYKLANSNTLQRYAWNASGTVDTGTNLSDSTVFSTPTNQMAGFALQADSSSASDQFIAYALGQQALGNITNATVRKTSALTNAIYRLTNTGGNLDGSVVFADTARRGKAIIRPEQQAIYLLNVGNSIARYNMSTVGAVPVSVSGFTLE